MNVKVQAGNAHVKFDFVVHCMCNFPVPLYISNILKEGVITRQSGYYFHVVGLQGQLEKLDDQN